MRQMDVEVQKMLEGQRDRAGSSRSHAGAVGGRIRRSSAEGEARQRHRLPGTGPVSALATRSRGFPHGPRHPRFDRREAPNPSARADLLQGRHPAGSAALRHSRDPALLPAHAIPHGHGHPLLAARWRDHAEERRPCRAAELPGSLRRSGLLGVGREHALFHRYERGLPSAHRPRLCDDSELDAGQSGAPQHPAGALHPAVAVHRSDHRDHLAAAARPERGNQQRADDAAHRRLQGRMVLLTIDSAPRPDLRQHLGGLPALHGEPSRRPAGHPEGPLRGSQTSMGRTNGTSSGTSPCRS